MHTRLTVMFFGALFVLIPLPGRTQERTVSVDVAGHIVRPQQAPPGAQDAQRLKAPPGFVVDVFAEKLGKPRVLAVADDGSVYVTRRDPGDVLVIRDTDGDGRADEIRVAVRRPMLHGLALQGRRAFFVTVNDVFSADIAQDGTFVNTTRIVDDLPEAGQHGNRTIAIGPDKFLYISVGSTCNECNESSPENATIVRLSPDGKSRQIFASGLRNTIGFDWHPDTHELFGLDHGIDWLGDDEQPEEFNHIQEGKQYGWPYVYANGKINPKGEPVGAITSEEWAKLSTNPVLTYTAHAAPMQMLFYTGAQFPEEFHGDVLAAMHGSWNRAVPSGYEVVRIRFRDGTPTAVEPFLTGFLTHAAGKLAIIGRPVGVAMTREGAVLVSDDANGRIYRIAYRRDVASAEPDDRSSTSGRVSPRHPTMTAGADGKKDAAALPPEAANPAVALARAETRPRADATLTVSSSAFTSGGPIPLPYSAYGERFSPALAWTGAPSGTESFVLLMEDPDADQPKPFVHWVLYNVPAAMTGLPESLPTVARLREPKDALQGLNSRGQIGYFGPRPPVGDPAHHYHFQIFALDTTLALPPGATRDALLRAIQGHVLGRGELVGTFHRP